MGSTTDKNTTVLIVEDDDNLRRILKTLIQKLGFAHIREAENGQKAWATMHANADIGFVITDLNMPVMDGLKLAQLIRSNSKYNGIPILVITAADTKETIVKAGKAGVDGYIIKPFDVKQVIKKIDDAFAHRAAKNAK